jgi:hypothetical protein
MLIARFIWGLLFIATVSTTVSAKTCVLSTDFTKPTASTSLLMSWRVDSEKFTSLYEQLSKDYNRLGKSKKMVKNVFYRTHQKLLQQYEPFSMAQDTFNSGNYDCVSGSLILAGLLDYFGFDYEIKETTYHVFLKVAVENDFVLLEATDPIEGFIQDKAAIQSFLDKYRNGFNDNNQRTFLTANNEGEAYIYRSINLQKLIGLQYFNQAIKHYNSQNELLAYQFSVSALKLYKAERIEGFSDFLKQRLSLSALR